MTDQERPDEEQGFDDPVDAWVRDLLASSRVTGPVPDDVADRLDATLASLRAERVGTPEAVTGVVTEADAPANVVPLRRRILPLVAAAAAVLVVAGGAFGVTRLVGHHAASSQSASGSASGAGATPSQKAPPATAGQSASGSSAEAAAVPRLSRATFAQDAAAVMRTFSSDQRASATGAIPGTVPAPGTPTAGSGTGQPPAGTALNGLQKGAPPVTATPGAKALAVPATACPGPRLTGAVTVPATLDGTVVALVFRPPSAGVQRVEAWSCDGSSLLASAAVGR